MVWQANLIWSGNLSFSASFSSRSDLFEQFSKPSIISTLQVEHLPTPPHALRWGTLFLREAVSNVSLISTLINLSSGLILTSNDLLLSVIELKSIFKVLCDPSQKGWAFVILQPQKNLVSDFSAKKGTGLISVPLWLPSQNG